MNKRLEQVEKGEGSMLEEITLFCHSSIKLSGSKIVYIDPYNIKKELHDADFILCTHTHYDHYSPEDIEKVQKNGTILIAPTDINGVIKVMPNVKYEIEGLRFHTTYAYNKDKEFHPREKNWVGYVIELDGKRYYIAGDTDNIPEIRDIQCDVAFLPIGGTYTMNPEEAAELCKILKAEVIIPTHYGLIVGDLKAGEEFAARLKGKNVKIYIK